MSVALKQTNSNASVTAVGTMARFQDSVQISANAAIDKPLTAQP
jgi:hypothetical protein